MSTTAYPLSVGGIHIRDPFIVTNPVEKAYHLFAQSGNRAGSDFLGVEAYSSPDLHRWSEPQRVLELTEPGLTDVWAPEVHAWNDQWYLLVTLTYASLLPTPSPDSSPTWPVQYRRGTHVFRSDHPLGPFRPMRHGPLTPPDWSCLDGTLHIENGEPWLIFCHEWTQIIDGRMMAVRLSPNLDEVRGEPQLLFHASDAPGSVRVPGHGLVTDGPFLHRPPTGGLLLLWSTFIPSHGYTMFATRSSSGQIAGPWTDHAMVAGEDGGHGMLFRTLGGELLLALHRPNHLTERLHLSVVGSAGAPSGDWGLRPYGSSTLAAGTSG